MRTCESTNEPEVWCLFRWLVPVTELYEADDTRIESAVETMFISQWHAYSHSATHPTTLANGQGVKPRDLQPKRRNRRLGFSHAQITEV